MSDDRPEPLSGARMGFDEAVARFVRTNPTELAKKLSTISRSSRKMASEEIASKPLPVEGSEQVPRIPRPFTFSLTATEIAEMEAPSGQGGHQNLHARIRAELANGSDVTFNDEEMGEMIRYMTQYGSGGFQGRLRRAFLRSLCDQIGAKPV